MKTRFLEENKMPEKIKTEDIKKIIDLFYKENKNYQDISSELGFAPNTVMKYINDEGERRKKELDDRIAKQTKDEEEKQKIQLQMQIQQQQKTTTIPEPVIPPYPSLPTPDEWFKQFLASYRLKEGFILSQINRVKRRNELPHPTDLMADIKEMDSGQTHLRQISYIVEDYAYQLKDYMQYLEKERDVVPPIRHGISLRNPDMREPPMGYGYPQQRRDPYDMYPSPYPPQPYMGGGGGYDRIARLEDELRRRDEESRRKSEYEYQELKLQLQQGGQKDPYMDRIEAKLERIEEERRAEDRMKIQQLESAIRQGSGVTPQDVSRMIQMERDKITASDIQRMIDGALKNERGLTETDLKYQEIKDKHSLEVMKLQETGKTRETIASAVKSGFAQIGQAIVRTAQEAGTEEPPRPMPGYSDNQYMWQAECPYCKTLVTAPLTAKIIQCPGCNKQLEIKGGEEKQNLVSSEAGFSVKTMTDEELQREEERPGIPLPSPIHSVEEELPPLETQPPLHNVPQPEKFICEFCGKEFEAPEQLWGHRLHHLKEKKLQAKK